MPDNEMSYTEVVAEGDINAIKEIAGMIVDRLPCRVVSEPSAGMVMVKHADPLEYTPFYMGEAFVMQCEVVVDERPGYGCVLGAEPERALCGAIIDAVLGTGHRLSDLISGYVAKEAAAIRDRREAEDRLIAGTRVNFEQCHQSPPPHPV